MAKADRVPVIGTVKTDRFRGTNSNEKTSRVNVQQADSDRRSENGTNAALSQLI